MKEQTSEKQHYNACYRVRQIGCGVDVNNRIITVDKPEFDYWTETRIPKSVLLLHRNYDYNIRINK